MKPDNALRNPMLAAGIDWFIPPRVRDGCPELLRRARLVVAFGWTLISLAIVESPAIGFDKFDGISDQLKRTSLNTLIGFPFLLIERSDDGITRSSFQLIANSLEFIKTDGRGFEEGQDNEDTPF